MRLTDRQTMDMSLVDSIPASVRRQARLAVTLRVLSPVGELLQELPETPLDGRCGRHPCRCGSHGFPACCNSQRLTLGSDVRPMPVASALSAPGRSPTRRSRCQRAIQYGW